MFIYWCTFSFDASVYGEKRTSSENMEVFLMDVVL